jgi:hypothetical protein
MTEIEKVKVETELVKRYLYAELKKKEREKLENEFFLDDELFFEVMNLENQLIDKYVKGKLPGDEVLRFEKSLEKFPDRKQKVANAKALRDFIEDEKQPEVLPVAAANTGQTFWQKLADFFTIKSPILGSAIAGLMIIFGIMGILLFLDNRQKGEELARLQNEKGNLEVWQKRETELKEQLNASNQQVKDLENQLAEKGDDAVDFTRTLAVERLKNQQLARDLEKLRQEKDKPLPIPTATPKSSGSTMASIILSPIFKNQGNKFKTTVGEDTEKLAVNVSLPDEVKADERFSVQLNGQPFRQNVAPNKKSINLTIPIKNLNLGENKLTVINKDGKEITNYTFNVDKPQD